jgi:RNA polymerase sigma-70 factor (ECF subfamily)
MSIVTTLQGAEEDMQVPNAALAMFLRTTEERRSQFLQVARRITNGSEDAEDILQDAFVKAYKALPDFRGDSTMATWLTAIVRNTALEYLRKRRGRFFVSIEFLAKGESETIAMDFPDTRLNPEENCGRREIEELVRGEVSRLSMNCRHVIERCVFEEMPQSDVAHALHIDLATVKSRVFRAKRMLRRAMSARAKSWHKLRTTKVPVSERTKW